MICFSKATLVSPFWPLGHYPTHSSQQHPSNWAGNVASLWLPLQTVTFTLKASLTYNMICFVFIFCFVVLGFFIGPHTWMSNTLFLSHISDLITISTFLDCKVRLSWLDFVCLFLCFVAILSHQLIQQGISHILELRLIDKVAVLGTESCNLCISLKHQVRKTI